MRTLIVIFSLMVFLFSVDAQVQNLVPNPGFEFGPNQPRCAYQHPTPASADQFDGDIFWWRSARFITDIWNSGNNVPSVDWMQNYPGTVCNGQYLPLPTAPYYPNRYIRMLTGADDYMEGVKTVLLQPLQGNKTYILRFKAAGEDGRLRIRFCKWTISWMSNDPANIRLDLPYQTITDNKDTIAWQEKEVIFNTNGYGNNQLGLISIVCDRNTVYLDDVEVYEYCPETLFVQNKTYYDLITYDTLEAKNIIAGYNVTPSIPPGQVLVKNGAEVVYKAEQSIVLDTASGSTGFYVEPGGDFFAYISPCGVDCPTPPEYYYYANICADTCLSFNLDLGGIPLADLDILWASVLSPGTSGTPTVSTMASNVFTICLPNNISGGITYTVTFKNKICLKESVVTISITYNTNPLTNPSVNIINVQTADSIQYDLQYDPNAVSASTQVYYLDGSQWVQVFNQTYSGGQLTSNPLSIQTGFGISNCNTIAIAAQSKNSCNALIAHDSVVIPPTQIQVFDPNQLPNVFVFSSPTNNHFYIHADGYIYGHLDIFNSWGSLIYSNNFNLFTTPATVWDGHCNTGICNPSVPLSAGTYYYMLDLYNCNLNQTTYGPIFFTYFN
jgi:hypothetical protein